ncbi:methyltransferase [Parahaliea sp. F7430]|uniref:Methyltransferase n=1 Tax=Sediminihaliea albiluteola TaxID=2758564 RepID=A0A7W2TUH9_9GAMM|nr:methyltransferase [Sediminihaliea albiluteola]MBA6412209.1 methyltransferase [Sediminihaliea albiluteola]
MSSVQPAAQFETPFGCFELQRYPRRPNDTLNAWCAADSLLLEAFAAEPASPATTLVVNDEHGALTTALKAAWMWSDSALSVRALRDNLARNRLPECQVIWSTEPPPATASIVLMRVPKQLAYFEYQLACLATTLAPGTRLVIGGMDKHLSPQTAAIIERYIGPTERHRGRRKARLFSATIDGLRHEAKAQWSQYYCQALNAELRALPNVFSREQLDRGSELLIAQLQRLAPVSRLIDLACGNGVLGLAALDAGLAQELVFCDESAMAVASARENLEHLQPQALARCEFHHGDGLKHYRGAKADLILCNPPFHLQHTVDDFAGRRLLSQAAKQVSSEGKLCLVANRHLNYQAGLKRRFAALEKFAANNKFTVWLASRPLAAPAGRA